MTISSAAREMTFSITSWAMATTLSMGGAAGDWTDSLVILASDGTDTTSYGTDWTISLDTGTMTMVDGSDQLLLSDDATGTIDFSDGSKIELENIDNVSW